MDEQNKINNKVVQTYADDMAGVLEDDHGGLVKKIINEEEARDLEKQNLSPESGKNKIFMFLSVIFLALSLATFALIIFTKKDSALPMEASFSPMISNDETTFVEIGEQGKDEITRSISDAVNASKVKYGGIEGIYLTLNKNILGLRQFLGLMKSNLNVTGNDFVDDNFMLGVHNADKKSFFILLKMRSLPDIFPAMHAWEDKMFADLQGLLGLSLNADSSYLLTANFEDGIVQNKNARILYNKDRGVVLEYVFADDTHILITSDEGAVREVISRLAGRQVKQ